MDKVEESSMIDQHTVDQLPVELFTEKFEELKSVVSYLVQWKCCTRCILRFLGEAQPCVFQKSIDILNAWVLCHSKGSAQEEAHQTEAMNETEQKMEGKKEESQPFVCIVCLGLLQEQFNSPQFLEYIKSEVDKEPYEYTSFSISISMPVTIILREHALLIALRDKFKTIYYGRGKEALSPIKDVWKWTHSDSLADIFKAQCIYAKSDTPFEITMLFEHPNVEKECNFLFELFPNTFVKRKYNSKPNIDVFAKMAVLKALTEVSDARFQKYYQCPPRKLEDMCILQAVTSTHDSLFLAGRYNKYSRTLPQTPWIINGERKGVSSIEEYICDKLKTVSHAKEFRFSASGREDIDVKMLGSGRPFCIEVINPHRVNLSNETLLKLQKEINGSTEDIQIRDLQVVTRDATDRMKEGESEKIKLYSALCWSAKSLVQSELDSVLSPITDLVLDQKTPVRVLHRRPLATRARTVHRISAELIDDHHFTLHLSTQAGTYIKEFVHGDFGRTKPSLGTLLSTECDILQLDVEGVLLDWPPPINSA